MINITGYVARPTDPTSIVTIRPSAANNGEYSSFCPEGKSCLVSMNLEFCGLKTRKQQSGNITAFIEFERGGGCSFQVCF
jgi:hypothetical protein